MYFLDHFNRFYLYNNPGGDYQIKPLSGDVQVFVSDGYRDLPLDSHPAKAQFMDQRLLIDTLKQPWPEMAMHLDCCSDYLTAGVIQFR